MNSLTKILACAILMASANLSFAYYGKAEARQVSITAIQSQGFRSCKAQGRSGYTAIVRGKLNSAYYGVRGGTDNFTVRYCFPTASQCERFIGGIKFTVPDIDRIRFSDCAPR